MFINFTSLNTHVWKKYQNPKLVMLNNKPLLTFRSKFPTYFLRIFTYHLLFTDLKFEIITQKNHK